MLRAIVVDDSRAVRAILIKMLGELGFEVIDAVDGRDGLAKLDSSNPPRLALFDWNMPELNGLELLKTVRSVPQFDEMKIMMVTTESEVTKMVQALEAGANEYVMKPFDRDIIRDKLQLLGVLDGMNEKQASENQQPTGAVNI